MSNLDEFSALIGEGNKEDYGVPVSRVVRPRQVKLSTRTGVNISRTLPHRELRKIGAWVFLDSYGPTQTPGAMQIAAHPHTGLQTVTWLFSGSILHHDSLGTRSLIQSRELNLMTSGFGIAHSEISIDEDEALHGVQLWIALPEDRRNGPAEFAHHVQLPRIDLKGALITLFVGEILGERSTAKTFSPLVGAQIDLEPGKIDLPVNVGWEHGVLVARGNIEIDEKQIRKDELLFIPPGQEKITIGGAERATLLLIGGAPFTEKFIMWWNFLGRSHEEVVEMRKQWEEESSRFPGFTDSMGERLPAPEMPHLKLAPR